MLRSARYGLDMNDAAARAASHPALTIAPLHWAAEWLRPVNPDFKMVGPIMAGPGKALSQEFEVQMGLCCLHVHRSLCTTACMTQPR